jgi:hypothetical protein
MSRSDLKIRLVNDFMSSVYKATKIAKNSYVGLKLWQMSFLNRFYMYQSRSHNEIVFFFYLARHISLLGRQSDFTVSQFPVHARFGYVWPRCCIRALSAPFPIELYMLPGRWPGHLIGLGTWLTLEARGKWTKIDWETASGYCRHQAL